MSLWDLRGKLVGQPVGVLLGLARDRVPCYATARSIDPTPETVYEEAKLRRSEGYRGFKIQFWDGLERDIPRFRAARDGAGPDFPLMEDAAGGYTYVEAMAAGRELERLGYTWFEEAIPDRQLDQLRRLADQLDVPILADGDPAPPRAAGAPPPRGGGHRPRRCADQGRDHRSAEGVRDAELFGYDLEIHGLGGFLSDMANLHVAPSVENCRFVEAHHPVYERGVGGPLAIDADGCRVLPDGPGLGVEIDWDWIDDHTDEVIRSGVHRVTTLRVPWSRDSTTITSPDGSNAQTLPGRTQTRCPSSLRSRQRQAPIPVHGPLAPGGWPGLVPRAAVRTGPGRILAAQRRTSALVTMPDRDAPAGHRTARPRRRPHAHR